MADQGKSKRSLSGAARGMYFFGLDKNLFDPFILVFYFAIQPGNTIFYSTCREPVTEIYADVNQYEVWSHVHPDNMAELPV